MFIIVNLIKKNGIDWELYHKLISHLVDEAKEDGQEEEEGELDDPLEDVEEEDEGSAGHHEQPHDVEEIGVVGPNKLLDHLAQFLLVGFADGQPGDHLHQSWARHLSSEDSWKWQSTCVHLGDICLNDLFERAYST